MDNNTQELQDQMLEALSQVIDPELRCDIVSLGLVYELAMDKAGNVTVKLTLTTMGCPLTAVLDTMITRALMAINAVNSVKIDLVWEPAWSTDRMSRYAKMVLGIHN